MADSRKPEHSAADPVWHEVRRLKPPTENSLANPFVGAVVALAISVAMLALGHLVLAIVAAALSLLTLAITAAWPTGRRLLERLALAISGSVGFVVRELMLLAMFVVAFVPAAMVHRLRGGRRVLQRPDPQAATYWDRVLPTPALPRWEFTGQRWRGRRRGGGAVTGAVALLGLAFAANFAIGVWYGRNNSLVAEVRNRELSIITAEANADNPWIGAYWREHWQLVTEHIPFLGWHMTMAGADSEHIHDEQGMRRSYQGAVAPGRTPLRVAFYGGSTMWGYGARDEHTIPSEFARIAERAGIPVIVENHGMMGYTAFAGVIKYHLRRLEGAEVPEVVVFYDGINDFLWLRGDFVTRTGVTFSLAHNGPWSYRMAALLDEPRSVANFFEHYSGVRWMFGWKLFANTPTPEGPATMGHPQRVAAAITRSYQLMTERGTIDGYAFFGFLQPTAATKRGLTAGELAAVKATGGELSLQFGKVYLLAGNQMDKTLVTDLTAALDGTPSVFVDLAHLNEAGNRLIAEAMFKKMRERLETLAQ